MDLLGAVTRGSLDEVDDAIEKGSDLTVRDGEGNTAMLKACMRGEKKIVKALMRAGSSLGDKNKDGEGVLHITFSNGFVDLGIYLLHKGADPRMETADGMDWITYCDMAGVDMGSLQAAIEESQNAAQRRVMDPLGGTEGGNVECGIGNAGSGERRAEHMDRKAGGKEKKERGTDRRREEMVASMLDSGAVSESIALIGKTQERVEAADREREGEGKAAVELQVRIERQAGEELRAFAERGDTSKVERHLAAGVPPDQSDELGNTALMLAAAGGHKRTCKALLRACADINASNQRSQGPLMRAREGGWEELADYLISKGADHS